MRASCVACLGLALLSLSACGGYKIPKTEGINSSAQVDGPLALGQMRLKHEVCEGIDVRPDYGTLDERAVIDFLKQRGFPVRTVRARSDLIYVEFQVNPEHEDWVRLRVAILPGAPEAGLELHRAILEHGQGRWGIHRGNLAVLAPSGDLDDIIAMAAKTKLACWGVLTIAGRDDAFVVPGAYREL